MAEQGRDAAFTEYVTARSPWLRRVAYLMCQDWHRADDLVQTSITKLYVHWNRASHADNIDGYARAVLVNTFLAEQRSMWWRRVASYADAADAVDPRAADLDTGLDLRAALAEVPPRQRAAIVLRYYCDLSVEEVARTLNCSPGTVKSQTSRGLDTLRRVLSVHPAA
jgi:RNA polymerase sigma-70 factor (sigma-E family)